MSAETVIMMLKEFNEEGIINMYGIAIEVLDNDWLIKISDTF